VFIKIFIFFCVCVYIYIYIYIYISNKLITTFESIEFINYVIITWHISAHLEPWSGDTLFKAIKYWIVIMITMDPYYNFLIKLFINNKKYNNLISFKFTSLFAHVSKV
jgi:hypothetical protein